MHPSEAFLDLMGWLCYGTSPMVEDTQIGRYLVGRRLATGGMAELFLGKLIGAAGFEKEVVIKRILPQWSADADFIAMLIDEAKIAVRLNHPNIVQVFELGREGEAYYIAMEYVRGVDLRRLLQKTAALQRRIPVDVAVWIASEVLEGLAYAHPFQIVHRDVSPQNILVSFDGRVRLTDFGIAKAASRSQETVVGVLKGKFAYMSPEQANQEHLDCRSDLFSMGVVLYEILAGERLFYRSSDLDTLDRIRRGVVEFSEKAEAAIPESLRAILRRALEPVRELRHADAESFRKDLLNFASREGAVPSRQCCAGFL